jgi:hypothetical protein
MIPSFPWCEIVCWPTRPSETVRQAGSTRVAGECSDIAELPAMIFDADFWEVFASKHTPTISILCASSQVHTLPIESNEWRRHFSKNGQNILPQDHAIH